jgi:hypothetical protein
VRSFLDGNLFLDFKSLHNVREQVHSGFDSTTLDNKVHVSFGCAPALQTLNDSKVALKSVARQVLFGLITLKRTQATPAAAPSASAARKAGKQPAAAASKLKASTGGGTAGPSGRKAGTAGGRQFLKTRRTATRSSQPCSGMTRQTSRRPTTAH